MVRPAYIVKSIIVLLLLCSSASANNMRFPPPEFESGYESSQTTIPAPRAVVYQYIDIAVLFTALGLAGYLVLKKRSRKAIFVLMLFSLAYFGFYLKGCICPIGSIQNIVLSFFDPTYSVSIIVLLVFLLPLIFTVFFGRTFCSAVCPLGVIQDAVLLRPISIPIWLENALRLMAYIYLAAAVLFAATGSAFVICRYDPFVSFFRLNGNINLLILGACILFIGVFIGRPYCRFLCPYGVILRQISRVSKWHARITPAECIKCRLCEDSCPFGAIRKPTVQLPVEERTSSKNRLLWLLAVIPVLIFLGGWGGSGLKTVTSRVHATVRLAERIALEQAGQVQGTTDASDAFRTTGTEIQELYDSATNIRQRFGLGGWILGGFLGLVIGLKLTGVSLWRERTDYQTDEAGCLACGRCFEYCPVEQQRRKKKDSL
jgi:NosR/NirI family transcriptional regulator, nitrous oxide reductase regulator